MGKARRKNKFERPNPSGIQSVKEFQAENELCSLDPEKGLILGAIEKLKSPVLSDRECGAEALALCVHSKEAIEELLQNDFVRIAAPLLLDSSPTVRHSVAGSLRNITTVGGHSVCEHFVERDVLTPLVHLFEKHYRKWRPSPAKDGKIDSPTEIFIEATNILWNLCESSEKAVNVFTNHNLLGFFLPCLSISVYGPKVAIASAQCLQAVTENNPDLLSHYPPDHMKKLIMGIVSLDGNKPVEHHLRTLAAGIFLNVHGGKLSGCSSEETCQVFGALSKALSISLSETIQLLKNNSNSQNDTDKNDEDLIKDGVIKVDEEELAREDILAVLLAKQAALEVLTNICCDDDGADEWESLCSSEAGDDMEMPMEEDSPCEVEVSLPDEMQATLEKLNLLQHVEEHALVPEDTVSLLASVKNSRDALEKLVTMRCRALLCLHNMVAGGIRFQGEQSSGHLHQLWVSLGHLVLDSAGKGQADLLEATTGCLRALIQRLAEEKALTSVSHLTLDDLSALYKVVQGSPDTKVRVNILRIVSTVGVLLQLDKLPQPEPLISSIGQFLLELGLKDEDVWVNAEAADAVMDVFAEDHLDGLAQQIMLVQKCKHIHSNLKSKVRQLQREPGEHFPMVAMAKTNLSRFIKYKSKTGVQC